jgi:glycosyltransferase involved in cell wall biosynthesis
MIHIFELTWTGTVHAPGNSATTQVVASAFPGQRIIFHADPSHIAELRRDPLLDALPNLSFAPVSIPSALRDRPSAVSGRRWLAEARTVLRALRATPRDEPCLVFLISTSATGVAAATFAARFSGRRVAIQVGLHGNLSEAFGWRSRNPLTRRLDLRSALDGPHAVPVRFLVLESHIRDSLARRLPATADSIDVLPLPVNTAEAQHDAPALSAPVRFGLVGLGSEEKGLPAFLRLAREMRARHPGSAEFVHVGRVPEEVGTDGFDALVRPPVHEQLPREDFAALMESLHCVVLPLRGTYYDFAASGALIDAMTWLRPVVALRGPLTEALFDECGPIGALCDDESALLDAVEAIALNRSADCYARHVAVLRAARERREPAALAARYRSLVARGFPSLGWQDAA